MSFSMRLSQEEESLFKSYAKLHGISLTEALKRALLEKIEDEYDVGLFEEAYDDYVKSGCKSKPINELWEELEL